MSVSLEIVRPPHVHTSTPPHTHPLPTPRVKDVDLGTSEPLTPKNTTMVPEDLVVGREPRGVGWTEDLLVRSV